jgi:hypothetical protein
MVAALNIVGEKYGRIRVLNRAHNDKYGRATWYVVCDCGSFNIVSGNNLRNGNIRSCGCAQREATSGEKSVFFTGGPIQAHYRRYRKDALNRGYNFDLDLVQVTELFNGNCNYCGAAPIKDQRGVVRNGIDRVDASKGYSVDNCVSCCFKCNMLKGTQTESEFVSHMKKILTHMKSKAE